MRVPVGLNLITNTLIVPSARSMAASARVPSNVAMDHLRSIIPPFNKPFHKGEHGKVYVMGGSVEYTGAPFYAAVSSLKVGADLSYVLCHVEAAVAIKSYSPELIVHPVWSSTLSGHAHAKAADSAEVKKLASLLERADALVIGPGLGRDKRVMDVAAEAIRMAGAMGLPTVIDGDALYLVSQQPDVVKGHTAAILTPNPVEFQRLVDAVTGKGGSGASASASSAKSQPRQAGDKRDHAAASSDGNASGTPQDDEEADAAAALSRALGGVAILRKGSRDIAVASTGAGAAEAEVAIVVGGGSPRRCGGQGDVLAGTLGTMLAWARRAGAFPSKSKGSGEHNSTSSSSLSSSSTSPHRLSPREALVACGYGAALLTRRAAAMAFSKHHRAMTTPDLIAELGGAFEDVFPDTLYQGGAADD